MHTDHCTLTVHNCCCKDGSSKRSNISISVYCCHLNGVVCGGWQSDSCVYSVSRGSAQHFRNDSVTARCWSIANHVPCDLTVLMNAVHRIPGNRDGSGIKCEWSDFLGCTAGDWEKGSALYEGRPTYRLRWWNTLVAVVLNVMLSTAAACKAVFTATTVTV